MKKRLTIYLADLIHNYISGKDIWTIPLGASCVAAYTDKFFKTDVEIKIFSFPDKLHEAINEKAPDILGVSNYMWNCELSKKFVRDVKKINKNIVTIMGGPNITQTTESITEFLRSCELDFYISYFGEDPFKCIKFFPDEYVTIESILVDGAKNVEEIANNNKVHGLWYYDCEKEIAIQKPVIYQIKNLDDIPSPYTNGYLDESFEEDLFPMIETNRGCPFECTFCDWGSAGLRKVYKYSVDRIKSDIEYIMNHSRDERLMIDDANFGMLGKRDLEIANYLKKLNEENNYPDKLVLTWSQKKSPTVLKIAEALKEMFMVTTSFQSMNPLTLSTIKRNNIDHDQFKTIVEFCDLNEVETYGELMVMLPNETLESHFKAIRYYFDMKIDFLNINPLILLEGAELNSRDSRKKHCLKTKWRLMENCYGFYGGEPVIEYQEMVISTNSFEEKELYVVRPISWLIHMSWNLRRHNILILYMQSLGINPLDFFLEALNSYKLSHNKVKNIFEDALNDVQDEYHTTKKKLIKYYSKKKQLNSLKKGSFRKLNIHYASRVAIECESEFIDYYKIVAIKMLKDRNINTHENISFLNDCVKFMKNRVLTYPEIKKITSNHSVDKTIKFNYDILKFSKTKKCSNIQDLNRKSEYTLKFKVEKLQKEVLKRHMDRFKSLSGEYQMRKMQETVHGMHKKNLLLDVEYSNAE